MPETGHWWKLQTSDTLELPSLLLNLIIGLRSHAEGPFLGGHVDPASAFTTKPKYCVPP